jgi:DNA repair protein RadD
VEIENPPSEAKFPGRAGDRLSGPSSNTTKAGARQASIELRPYQSADVARIRSAFRRGHRCVLYVLPTGGGKTVIFAFIAASAANRGRRILILVHRQELVDQTSGALSGMAVPHGIIAAGYPSTDAHVQVASVMTMVRRLDRYQQQPFDLVVIDEAHHSVAGSWRTILDAFPAAYVLGVTATPERLDGKGLGVGSGGIFDHLIIGPRVSELVAGKYLVPARTFGWKPPDLSGVRTIAGEYDQNAIAAVMSHPDIVGDAVEHYAHMCGGRAIAYCVNIKHSELVAERFRAQGFRAQHIDDETDDAVRRAAVAALAAGELEVLTNCQIFTEGVDVPVLDAVIELRPTQSLALCLQMQGRALRAAPGKMMANIFDHAGNWTRHGLYDEDRVWSLQGRAKQKRGADGDPAVTCCSDCHAVLKARVKRCPHCGFAFEIVPHEIVEMAGELSEISQDDTANVTAERLRTMRYRAALQWCGSDPDKMRLVAQAKGYKHGWIWHLQQEIAKGEVAT